MKKGSHAVVLLSGGLDSTVTLALLRSQGHRLSALTVDYGQRHVVEVERAGRIAAAYEIDHLVFPLNLRRIGGSSLIDDSDVPKDGPSGGTIPNTYVPARNTIFLSLALAWAEVRGAEVIGLGVNAVDYSGYPDCRPEYLAAFERVARLGTRAGAEAAASPRIVAPLSGMNKAEIIRLGADLGIPFALTHSCYDPGRDGEVCGRCDSCRIRRRGFEAAGVPDPTHYREEAGIR